MIKRSDDIYYGCDVRKLRLISDRMGTEVLSVVFLNEGSHFNKDGELTAYLRDEIEKGSEIALHGYDHKDITTLPIKDAIWELIEAKRAIEILLEVNIRYYVPPYHKITKELTEYLKAIGLEVLCDAGEDLVQVIKRNDLLRPDTNMVYYHWWEMDLQKLENWLKEKRTNG